MFTLSLFICLCHSFVLGFAKMQQRKIERLEGIQTFLLQAPTAWSVSRSSVPQNNHTQNSFPKEIPAGKWTTRWRFPFFSISRILCPVGADLLSSESTFEDPQGNLGCGTALTDAPLRTACQGYTALPRCTLIIQRLFWVPALLSHSEQSPGDPQEMLSAGGGGEREMSLSRRRAGSVPSHGDNAGLSHLSHPRGGHGLGRAGQDVLRHLTEQ